jgi:glycosyltransferase involved in cell wall biosynthesis
MPTPLLIVSDSVAGPTGLGRISRELASRIHAHLSDVFEVGTCGPGASYSRQFPWPNYPGSLHNHVIPELASIWEDFAGDQEGILLFIWNASWLGWVADTKSLPNDDIRGLLQGRKVRKWGYFPVDSEGPNGILSEGEIRIMAGFDRVAAYTEWGKSVIDRSSAAHRRPFRCDAIPHGTESKIFFPADRREARAKFLPFVLESKGTISEDVLLIGINATNTPRKDWGLAFAVCGELLNAGVNVGLLAHTDVYQKHWNLMAMADAFRMNNRVIFTNSHLNDEQMAYWYAVCDVTLGIGSGEGWGLPIAESLAMGVPCITGDYAGAVDFTPKQFRVQPKAYRYEGLYCAKRPVFDYADVASRVMEVIRGQEGPRKPLLDSKFFWDEGVWPRWKRWLCKEGL